MRFVSRWLSPVGRRMLKIARSFGAVVFVCGAMAGVSLFTCWLQFGAQLGWSWQAISAGLAVIAIAVERALAFRAGRSRATPTQPAASLVGTAMALSVWIVASLALSAGTAVIAGWYPVTLLSSTAGSLLFHLPAAMLLFAVPAWCAGRLPSMLAATARAAEETEVPAGKVALSLRERNADLAADSQRSRTSPRAQAAPMRTDLTKDLALCQSASSSHGLPLAEQEGDFAKQDTAESVSLSTFLYGVAAGAFLDALIAAPLFGVHLAGALSTACATGWLIFRTSRIRLAESTETAAASTRAPLSKRPASHTLPLITLLLIGALIPVVGRMIDQLMAESSLLAQAWWTSLLAGAALALRRSAADVEPAGRGGRAAIVAGAWFAVVCAAYPLLLDLSLTLSALVSVSWLLILARCTLTACLALPLGFAAGSCLRAATGSSSDAEPRPAIVPHVPGGMTALAIGVIAGCSALVPELGVQTSGLAITFALALCAVPMLVRRSLLPVTRRARAGLAMAVVLIAASPWFARSYAPERAARLLFSTSVFTARQVSVERRFLTALDDARLDRVVEGTRSTLTLWRARGAQVQVRTNGVPAGFLSTDPVVLPQSTADVLHAALPLAMHPQPHRVLILGSGAGTALTTALSFPVMQAECVDADKRLIPLLADRAWPQNEYNPASDDRVTFRTLEPALAVASRCGEWDVILSTPPQSALVTAGAEMTAGFYSRCARRLTADGIFCQRFSHVDYGPEPILVLARTMQRAFRDVIVLESAPGEVLLLGTNSESGLVRDGFVSRLQTTHVRRALSNAGWDWCVVLNLAAYDNGSLAKLAEPSAVNTASNGRLLCRLPWELVRWAPKAQETAQRFAPVASRLAAWNNVDGNDPDLLSRLAEVTGQWKLMVTNPDQPWAYRKTLRERLEKSNRSVIVQTNGVHREMHPEDKFRKEYFEALGAAAGDEAPPTDDELDRLAGFLEPYDPLITYFAHHELAELYRRKSQPDPSTELRCRLHMAWYADPRDRSIRNIVRALDLLCRDDAAGLDRVAQWDQINGLMQLLMSRWELRGRLPPLSTQIALNDIDKSLAAAEQSVATLTRIAPEAGIAAEDCATRCLVLERSLVRPLETYRGRLLPHEVDETRKNKVLMKKVEEATAEVK